MTEKVTVIGAGLAGCECAYQIARRGHKVRLIECKALVRSPAHKTDAFAELVCSNSLKSNDFCTAGGLLKQELRECGSLLIRIADSVAVPAGNALAVDRALFSESVTKYILNEPNIEYVCQRADDWDENELTVLATGPLTLNPLSEKISERFGKNLHFYDAAAPIISADSLDSENMFSASRYGKGGEDYLNCPLNKEEYEAFWLSLINAETAVLHEFEKREIFEGCMPIEVMAKRGADTLRFGPLKPVGMTDPKTGKRPYAVIQLRAENREKTMYNLVGFQTNLKFAEQKRVFGLIPALKNAEFLRYGVMHRNTFIDAPKTIHETFCAKALKNTFVAGQMSGVEGYVESIGSGLWAGLNAALYLEGANLLVPPETTIMGSLMRYLNRENMNFQPMNANFGILPPLENAVRDKEKRKTAQSERALADLKEFKKANHLV